MHVQVYGSFDELPDKYAGLFEASKRESFFSSQLWYRALRDTVLDPHEKVRLYGVEDPRPLGLLVARIAPVEEPRGPKRCLCGFDSVYSLRGGPILSPDVDHQQDVVRCMVRKIRDERPRWEAVSLKFLDRDSPVFDLLVEELQAAGMIVEPYFQYGVWYEETGERSFDAYVASRGKTVRKNLRWMQRRLEKTERVGFEMVTGGNDLAAAIETYNQVYALSWKPEEQSQAFVKRLITDCAEAGYLRMGILNLDDKPVAVQLWIVCEGHAIIFKTAYDQSVEKTISVGGILTLYIMKHVIDVDHVSLVDFGLGDEDYKKSWMTSRRERWGVIAYDMRTIRGAIYAQVARSRGLAKSLMQRPPKSA